MAVAPDVNARLGCRNLLESRVRVHTGERRTLGSQKCEVVVKTVASRPAHRSRSPLQRRVPRPSVRSTAQPALQLSHRSLVPSSLPVQRPPVTSTHPTSSSAGESGPAFAVAVRSQQSARSTHPPPASWKLSRGRVSLRVGVHRRGNEQHIVQRRSRRRPNCCLTTRSSRRLRASQSP